MKLKPEQVNDLCKLVILSEEAQVIIDNLQGSSFFNVPLKKKLAQVNELIAPILNEFHLQLGKDHESKEESELAFMAIQKDFEESMKLISAMHVDKVRYAKVVLSMFSKLPENLIGYVPHLIESLATGEIKIENEQGEFVSFCESVMTTPEYLKKKEKTRPEIWSAEYMQRPLDIEGRLFENLRKFTDVQAIRENSEGCLAYIDVADEGSDYLCMLIGHVVNKDIYITDAIYTRANTDVTIPLCAQMLNDNKVSYVRVETNGMGALFLKGLRKELTSTQVIGIVNKTNKITRIIMNSSYVLRKFLFLETDKGSIIIEIPLIFWCVFSPNQSILFPFTS